MKKIFFLLLIMCTSLMVFAQAGYTANNQVTPYTGLFRPGINFDYYPPYSTNDLANIAAGNPELGLKGIGARTSRPGMRESFAEIWGYDFYEEPFEHFQSLGMEDMTMIVGFPAEWHRDQTNYCGEDEPLHDICANDPYTTNCGNTMFANLYTPIWDGGENGTPYNDDNYLAAYMYKMVTNYKDHVKFWEIWNEPGFDHSYVQGWQPPGGPDNWWDNDPSPCVNHFKAPIEHFVRTLRICYDVVKTVDPDAYVTLAGVGFESFLDAVLRNTDNPIDGSVTDEYPLGGGAYFDVMGFHTYPDIDGSVREFVPGTGWVYHRNSDAGASGVANRKNTYANRLAIYGYDDVTFPKKEWIITEINSPRVKFGENSMASDESQTNYITKATVAAMKLDVRQMHPYQLADRKTVDDAVGEFDLLGMYLNFNGTQPYDALVKNNVGIAYKTTTDVVFGTTYDATKTAAMNLPSNIDGGAFYDAENERYKYILWAVTTLDLSEEASANYSFPASFGITNLTKRLWDFSETNENSIVTPNGIALTGRPIYLLEGEADIDNGEITVICPSSFSEEVPANDSDITISWQDPTATTTCPTSGYVQITQTAGMPSGTNLIAGNYTITYTFSDLCANSSSCSFNINIENNNAAACEDIQGFTKVGELNGHAYYLSTADWNWQDGSGFAAAHGGYLTTINNAAENEYVKSIIDEVVYIGLYDLNTEGSLEWENGDPLSYTNYTNSCPWCNVNDETHDYAVMLHWDGSWAFENQWIYHKIIMEVDCNTSTPTEITLTCPNEINEVIPANDPDITISWQDPVATTTCANEDIVITQTSGPVSGTNLAAGTYTVTYAATDQCNNITTCSLQVNIESNNAGGCEDIQGFEKLGEFDGHGYYISTADWNWQDGSGFAAAHGGYLTTINSAAENDYVHSIINEMVFIGLYDLNLEGTVEWDNGDPVGYTNYNTSCAWCGVNDSNNDYAVMLHWDGTWSFTNQWDSRRIIMEVDCNGGPQSELALICGADINVTLPSGSTEIIVDWVLPVASTTCATNNIAIVQTAGSNVGSSLEAGSYTVTYEATDNCGNVEACSFNIQVTAGTTSGVCDAITGFEKLGELNGVGYYLSENSVDWAEANEMAVENGGHLATLTTATENAFLTDLVTDIAFIGLNDFIEEGTVVWANGDPVNYTNYSTCDWCGLNTDANDYGVLLPWNGEWSFNNQWVNRKFIMQKSCDDNGGGTDCSDQNGFTNLGTFNGHSYYLSTDNYNWNDAQGIVENAGGYLAAIGTQEENDFLKDNLGNNMVLIGFNDETEEGVGNWSNGEAAPLDLSYSNTAENDYAVMNFWAGTWQMVNGLVSKKIVLEMDCGNAQSAAPMREKIKGTQVVSLFPNPANDVITVRILAEKETDVELSIFNIQGQTIMLSSENLQEGRNEIDFSISELEAGVYFFRVLGKRKSQMIRFVKID